MFILFKLLAIALGDACEFIPALLSLRLRIVSCCWTMLSMTALETVTTSSLLATSFVSPLSCSTAAVTVVRRLEACDLSPFPANADATSMAASANPRPLRKVVNASNEILSDRNASALSAISHVMCAVFRMRQNPCIPCNPILCRSGDIAAQASSGTVIK